MILRIAYDCHSAATGYYFIPLGDALSSVIRSLCVDVGANLADYRSHVQLGKNENCVHCFEGRQQFCALVFRHRRTSFALQLANTGIGVHGDDQLIAQRLRRAEIAHMPDVKDIETAIGQDDAVSCGSPFSNAPAEFVTRDNLVIRTQSSSRSTSFSATF